ncbi:MAG: hypothetical protein C5B50_23240 [Verrucomicrobia bacterium]|nr:MAG: hypothetical protein C5B50_23240 [Verrucomicrobiota bacterium]
MSCTCIQTGGKHQTPNSKHFSQTPNTKHQTPEKHQAPNSNSRPQLLKVGDWSFFGVWCLVFGVCLSVFIRD